MSAVDPVAAIRTVLLADTAVAALVAARIYGAEIPESVTDEMPQAAIVVNPAGGSAFPGGGFQRYGAQRIDLWCHGVTLGEAWDVYLAAYEALKQMRSHIVGGVALKTVTVASKGVLARDPVTQWPTALSSWIVFAGEAAAT